MQQYVEEATQALARVLIIPAAHAREIVAQLDDLARESLHQAFEQAKRNLREIVDEAQQEQQAGGASPEP